MSKSLAEQVALLPEDQREEILADLDMEQLEFDWSFWGRPEQHLPDHPDWNILLALAGRGFGKTRASSEAVRDWAKTPGIRIGLVARTAAEVRDIIVEGDSGILNISPPSERPDYKPSIRRLIWPNGTQATLHTADEPDSLRGVQYHYSVADEFAAWRQIPDAVGMTAWANLRIATRLPGAPGGPKIFVATTPKRTQSLIDLLKEAETDPRIIVRRGSTRDNMGNLDPTYIRGIEGVYGGTRLAMQELEGMMLDDLEGALWVQDLIDDFRTSAIPLTTPLRVVGVDPTVAERPGDECGIIVAQATGDRDLYKRQSWVLEDATIQGPPDVWAKRVVETARKWGAPVVAEKNQGGVLIRNAIHQIDPNIPVFEVWSKQGKQLRAEPVSLCYEQGRVHHLGFFAELESQMTQWIPGDRKSPDRVDALVLALTALLITPPKGFGGGVLTARSVAKHRLPSMRPGGSGRRGAVFGAGIKRR